MSLWFKIHKRKAKHKIKMVCGVKKSFIYASKVSCNLYFDFSILERRTVRWEGYEIRMRVCR